MNYLTKLSLLALIILVVSACSTSTTGDKKQNGEKLKVVATTTQLTDLLKQLGGDEIDVYGLMGPGVDPHLYKASEGDVSKFFNANLIFYNGLHLEGKMTDLFEKIETRGKKTFAVANALPEEDLISVEGEIGHHDPHIWFSVANWRLAARYVADALADNDKENAQIYQQNLESYLAELDELEKYIESKIDEIPVDGRVLITAHDAFAYFGRDYKFEVVGLQGISTVSEAGAADVKNLATFIFERKIPAIFVESSVPMRNIEALQAAVKARGFETQIGGELFSDALGSAGTLEGTYVGMYRYNVDVITNALKK